MAHSAQLWTDSCPIKCQHRGEDGAALQSMATTFLSLRAPRFYPLHSSTLLSLGSTQFGQPGSAVGLMGMRAMTVMTTIMEVQRKQQQDYTFCLLCHIPCAGLGLPQHMNPGVYLVIHIPPWGWTFWSLRVKGQQQHSV